MEERTILVVVAHPDDCELTCAGSIARWVRDGDRAILVVAADGARGAKYPGEEPTSVAMQRRQEQEEAARIIGFTKVEFLGFPDGELADGAPLRSALVEQIRRYHPEVALTMDPLTVIFRNSYVNHRDHRILGIALLDALYPEASNAGYFPEQLEHGLSIHKVPELLLAQTERPNYWVDVSGTLDIRFDALRCHRSQIRLWPENGEAVMREQREYAAMLGVEHGARYVEAFWRVVVNPLA